MPESHIRGVWNIIISWAKSASDEDKAIIKEKLRAEFKSRLAKKRSQNVPDNIELSNAFQSSLRSVLEKLEPSNLIQKHAWLFKKDWIPLSADEIENDYGDYSKHDDRIEKLRREAVEEVYSSMGQRGLIELACTGEASFRVGLYSADILGEVEIAELIVLASSQLGIETFGIRMALFEGVLLERSPEEIKNIATRSKDALSGPSFIALLCTAPFRRQTWHLASNLGLAKDYWSQIKRHIFRLNDDADLEHAVRKLLDVQRPVQAFCGAGIYLDRLPSELIAELLMKIGMSGEEQLSNTMDSYYIKEALKVLSERGETSQSEMARLEFRHLHMFERGNENIPNFEREIETHPEIFAEIIRYVYKNADGQSDDQIVKVNEILISHSYRILMSLRRVPGTVDDSTIDPTKLEKWLKQVRSELVKIDRLSSGEYHIGELFGRSLEGKDGVWPCEGLRDVMEAELSNDMAEGFRIGKLNIRGVFVRGEGGTQERELAAQFNGWASTLNFTHPKVASELRKLRDSYLRDAKREDSHAELSRHL